MFLVSSRDKGGALVTVVFADEPAASAEATHKAMACGHTDVTLWQWVGSVAVEPQAVWRHGDKPPSGTVPPAVLPNGEPGYG